MKQWLNQYDDRQLFESSVNSEGIETEFCEYYLQYPFESSVNSEGIETEKVKYITHMIVWE